MKVEYELDQDSKLYGFRGVNDDDQWVIEPVYDDVFLFSNGYYRTEVRANRGNKSQFGLVSPDGKEIFSAINEDVSFLGDENGDLLKIIYVKYDGAVNLYDVNKNRVVETTFDYIGGDVTNGLRIFGINGKYGYVDEKFKEKIPAKYDDVYPFKNGLGRVRINNKYGFINTLGVEIVRCQYDDARDYVEGLARVAIKLDSSKKHWVNKLINVDITLYGFVDSDGKEVIPLDKYVAADDTFFEGLAWVAIPKGFLGDKSYGYIDKYGRVKIDFQYEAVSPFQNGLAIVEANGKTFMINKKGEIVK